MTLLCGPANFALFVAAWVLAGTVGHIFPVFESLLTRRAWVCVDGGGFLDAASCALVLVLASAVVEVPVFEDAWVALMLRREFCCGSCEEEESVSELEELVSDPLELPLEDDDPELEPELESELVDDFRGRRQM